MGKLRQRVAELEKERDRLKDIETESSERFLNMSVEVEQLRYDVWNQKRCQDSMEVEIAKVAAERDELMQSIHDQADRYDELTTERDALKQQRDELLESLREALDFVERHSNRWDGANGKHPFTVVEAASASVASVKERSSVQD